MTSVKEEPNIDFCRCLCCLQEIYCEDESLTEIALKAIAIPADSRPKNHSVCQPCALRLRFAERLKCHILDSLVKFDNIHSKEGRYFPPSTNNFNNNNDRLNDDCQHQDLDFKTCKDEFEHVADCKNTKRDCETLTVHKNVFVRLVKLEHLYSNDISINESTNIKPEDVRTARSREIASVRSADDSNSTSVRYGGTLTTHECPHCPKTFTFKSKLNYHIRSHSDARRFQCVQCHSSFKYKQHLIQHLKRHTGVGLHECDRCRKAFISRSGLRSHMNCHSEARNFKCALCAKTFIVERYLKRHMLSHGDVRDFKCGLCPKMYKFKQHLIRHTKQHLIRNNK